MDKKYFYILIFIFLEISLWFFMTRNNEPTLSLINSWIFKENQKGPIIGNLGGMHVSIPKPYAHFVEYENDPHFLKPRKGEPPKRTYQSKLRSFGFEFRYPDMAPLTSKTRIEKRKSTIFNTMWMRVGVKVAPYYDKDTINKLVKGRVTRKWGQGKHGYKQKTETVFGLIVYEVTGYDAAKRYELPSNGANDENVYYYKNDDKNIANFITCKNVKHDAAPCSHYFILPETNAVVDVGYRIGFLSQWREIQTVVTNLILNFDVNKPITQSIN